MQQAAAAVPEYLNETYWWAYVHPKAVDFFERQWLVNLILWGNFAKLRDAALRELGEELPGRSLQVASGEVAANRPAHEPPLLADPEPGGGGGGAQTLPQRPARMRIVEPHLAQIERHDIGLESGEGPVSSIA